MAPCPRRSAGWATSESGLNPRAQNKCQRREESGVWPRGWPCRDRSRLFLEELTVIIAVDHQGARTRRCSCLPVTPTPTRPPSKHVSHSLSISLLALSPSSNSFCSPSSHSLQSLFFYLFFFLRRESRVRNTITKCQSDSREGGKEIVSIPWLPPSLGPKRWCVGWGRGRGSRERA